MIKNKLKKIASTFLISTLVLSNTNISFCDEPLKPSYYFDFQNKAKSIPANLSSDGRKAYNDIFAKVLAEAENNASALNAEQKEDYINDYIRKNGLSTLF